ncbi:hypothetical protein K440DRAFT_610226 [Wilcoxina mikolae CBS 423.85]|nr:hypothetical protein K440DRAFT_610226 [Wilcoxina mikolae CBS 423.85]
MQPTSSGVPSFSKEKKYDRQLRLWGANGQDRLEAAHIALFGASSTGCEILKNLVLPGVGNFTIIDDKNIAEADVGVNFFLDADCLGRSRAERTAALLEELNPDVKGYFLEDSLTNLLSCKPELFQPDTTPFTLIVVVSPFSTSDILQLSSQIPTIIVYSLGFTTVLRIAAPTQFIVKTHPDSVTDLRLLNPWQELSSLASKQTKNLDLAQRDGGMSDHRHGHVPYVLLLLKYLEDWKASHNGQHPLSYKEKTEFKEMIFDKMRKNVAGGSEENYEEAAAAVLKHVREPDISCHTQVVLTDLRCTNPTADSPNFWIIANALREFRERADQGTGLLPLSGGFPDMKTESSSYVELRNIYRARAQRDALLVLENVKATLAKLGRDPGSITLDEVSHFTRHCNSIRQMNYYPISSEYSSPPDDHHKKAVVAALNSCFGDSLIHDYIAIRAWQTYCTKKGKFPGVEDKELQTDLEKVTGYAEDYLESLNYTGGLSERTHRMLREVVRTGGGELHVIASLAGGMVAQEIIKIITQQYVPVNNTVVFDGIKSRSSVFEF